MDGESAKGKKESPSPEDVFEDEQPGAQNVPHEEVSTESNEEHSASQASEEAQDPHTVNRPDERTTADRGTSEAQIPQAAEHSADQAGQQGEDEAAANEATESTLVEQGETEGAGGAETPPNDTESESSGSLDNDSEADTDEASNGREQEVRSPNEQERVEPEAELDDDDDDTDIPPNPITPPTTTPAPVPGDAGHLGAQTEESLDGHFADDGSQRAVRGSMATPEPWSSAMNNAEMDTGDPQGEGEDEEVATRPLVESWVFGVNVDIPLQCLTQRTGKQEVVYAVGHMVVLHDFTNAKQRLLYSHLNNVASVVISRCGRWLASSDFGREDASIQVVDASTLALTRTIFLPGTSGASAIAWSDNSNVIAALCVSPRQVDVRLFDWTEADGDTAMATLRITDILESPVSLCFYPGERDKVVIWSDTAVMMGSWEPSVGEFKARKPKIHRKRFNRVIGDFTDCKFDQTGQQLLCSTRSGNLLVWRVLPVHVKENDLDEKFIDPDDPTDPDAHPVLRMEAVKLVHLSDTPVNFLTTVNEFVVTGEESGSIRFYGDDLKLRYWFDQLKEGPIESLAFSTQPVRATGQAFPADASTMARRFAVPEFFVATRNSVIAKGTPLGRGKFEVLLREHHSDVNCIAVHPFLNRLITGSFSGYLKMWDYGRKVPLVEKQFGANQHIQSLAIDPTAEYLAVGFTNGAIQFLAALDFTELSCVFKLSKGPVLQMTFSHDGLYLAAADADRCVSVYTRPMDELPAEDDPEAPMLGSQELGAMATSTEEELEGARPSRQQLGSAASDAKAPSPVVEPEPVWDYLGKYRSHSKAIQSVFFGYNEETGNPRLLSIGFDKMLVEYDLANSSEDDLRILTSDRLEQEAVPQCAAWYPRFTAEQFLITANDEYKLKLYNPSTKMTRYTYQAQCAVRHIDRIAFLEPTESEEVLDDGLFTRGYMTFTAGNEVGMAMCPLDGNSYRYSRTIAHPSGVAQMIPSHDGRYLFTCGGADRSTVMYKVHRSVMDAHVKAGGEGMAPFYHSLPGGSRNTQWFSELCDFFYLVQLKVQGMDTQDPRDIGMHIPASEVPTLMRSVGFFPTEYQVNNMLNEIKFSTFSETGQYCLKVNLEQVLKLYINHLPVDGYSRRIPRSYRHLAKSIGEASTEEISTDLLLRVLQDQGEHMTEAELIENMCYLFCHPEEYLLLPTDHELGDALHTSKQPKAADFTSDAVASQLPANMDYEAFALEFLSQVP